MPESEVTREETSSLEEGEGIPRSVKLDEGEGEESDSGHEIVSSTDDDYYLSDTEDLDNVLSNGDGHERLGYSSTLADHSAYLASSLSNAMDSLQLDKSLVVQAQLSGNLNNDTQRLIDKRIEVVDRIKNLQALYRSHFSPVEGVSKLERILKDMADIENRIEKLQYGTSTTTTGGFASLFRGQKSGIVQKFPVEYNRARDKVIERQVEEDE